MTSTQIRRAAALVVALATASGLGTSLAGASASNPRAQNFTLFSANVRGKDAPMAVKAAGPIAGIGTESQNDTDTHGGQVNYVTLHFAKGTLRLIAPERFGWKPDLPSCTATANGNGAFTIKGGTGAYRGATGKGTFTARGVLIGARSPNGTCLGEKAPPTVNYVTVTLTGTISV